VSELLSGRHPIRPGGHAITVTRDGHFVLLNGIYLSLLHCTNTIPLSQAVSKKMFNFFI